MQPHQRPFRGRRGYSTSIGGILPESQSKPVHFRSDRCRISPVLTATCRCNRRQQVSDNRQLVDDRERADGKRGLPHVWIGVRSDHDDFRSRKQAREFPARVEPVHLRHEQVEQDDVWLQSYGLFKELYAVHGRTNDFAGVVPEQAVYRHDQTRVVVSEQDAGPYHGPF